MNRSRSEALEGLMSHLEEVKIDATQYFSDLEPQAFFDTMLNGEVETLLSFCNALGWSDLSATLRASLPIRGTAFEVLAQIRGFIVPEIRRLMAQSDIDGAPSANAWFWQLVHPRIKALAEPRFEAGFFGDAVEASFKEVNDTVKMIFKDKTGREADGAGLMTTAFSLGDPVLQLNALGSETDRNIQQGYMQIFAGAMTGIRNPKAHANLNPDSRKALHLIALASLLMYKIDERQ